MSLLGLARVLGDCKQYVVSPPANHAAAAAAATKLHTRLKAGTDAFLAASNSPAPGAEQQCLADVMK